MTDDAFVLDRVENPHPRMLAEALEARRVSGQSITKASFWGGYLAAMAAATGETTEALHAWLDRHEDTGDLLREPVQPRGEASDG